MCDPDQCVMFVFVQDTQCTEDGEEAAPCHQHQQLLYKNHKQFYDNLIVSKLILGRISIYILGVTFSIVALLNWRDG